MSEIDDQGFAVSPKYEKARLSWIEYHDTCVALVSVWQGVHRAETEEEMCELVEKMNLLQKKLGIR